MADTPHPRLPLDGIRVVDLTRNLAGPFCTMMLGDMGAEVIKVESPNGGDELRRLYRFAGRDDDAEDYFGLYNRNKRSLVLDLKSERGKDILWELVRKSDVFIQNLSPGAVDRLGFTWDAIHAANGRMVVVNISGFGPADRRRRAYDGVVQAASGIMDMTGHPDGPPAVCGVAIGDIEAALFAAYASLAALMLAQRTGEGTRVDVAMMDCLLAIQSGVAAEYLVTGEGGHRRGAESPHRVPHNIYETSDGRYVFLVTNNELWGPLCRALGLDQHADDPRFSTNQARVENRDLVNALLGGRIATLMLDEACEALERADIPHSPVVSFGEAITSPYVEEHEMLITIDGPMRDGRQPIKVINRPYAMSDGPPTVRYGPPRLGEANDYVIGEILGMNDG